MSIPFDYKKAFQSKTNRPFADSEEVEQVWGRELGPGVPMWIGRHGWKSRVNNFERVWLWVPRGLWLTNGIMGSGHMGTRVNRQTDMTENITGLQLHWWAVMVSHCSSQTNIVHCDRYQNNLKIFTLNTKTHMLAISSDTNVQRIYLNLKTDHKNLN